MEKLKFKMRGFWYKTWAFIFETDFKSKSIPPNDTCAYRWDLIIASFILLITFPVTIYRIIYLWVVESFDIDAPTLPGLAGQMVPTLFLLLFSIVGVMFADQTAVFETYRWYYVLYGGIITVVFGVILYSGFSALEWLWDKITSIKFNKSEAIKPTSTLKILYRGWRDKHCSPIDWEK